MFGDGGDDPGDEVGGGDPGTRPAASATANTKIWMVEVGSFNWVNTVVSANAAPSTTISAPTPNGWAVRRSATVCSTPWLATVAPIHARGP